MSIVNAEDVGLSWSTVTSPTTQRLLSVFMVGADDGWAVGVNGTILRWTGSSWNNVNSPTRERLYDVFMVGADDGWAVGFDGTIIHWTGTIWIPESSAAILVALLITITLFMVILAKRVPRKPTPFSA